MNFYVKIKGTDKDGNKFLHEENIQGSFEDVMEKLIEIQVEFMVSVTSCVILFK